MLSRSPEAHSLLQQQCDEQLRLGGEEKRGGVGPEPLDRHLTSNCFHRNLFFNRHISAAPYRLSDGGRAPNAFLPSSHFPSHPLQSRSRRQDIL